MTPTSFTFRRGVRIHYVRTLLRVLATAVITAPLAVLPILLVAEPLTALHRRGLFLAGWPHDDYDRVINMIVGPLFGAGIVLGIVLAARWIDERPLSEYGVRFDRAWWTNLAAGFGLGAMLMTLVFATERAAGWIVVSGGAAAALAMSFTVVKVLCVGVYEEVVARGYLLRNIGVIGSSLVFAALHAFNDNASVVSTLGLFVNGLLFAAAVRVTGRLSASIGLHIAWNLFEGLIFGFPVSGDKEGASFIAIRQLGSNLVTGGAFGPEAGLIGVAASLAGIAILYTVASGPPPSRRLDRRRPAATGSETLPSQPARTPAVQRYSARAAVLSKRTLAKPSV
jgi:membrane protease YdiL (CAAX protease family)